MRSKQVPLLRETAIDWGLMLTGIPLCLLARAANIFPLSALLNMRRRVPLPLNLQVAPIIELLAVFHWQLRAV